ncbi:hypothetical protein KC353_g55 [Hortaea werneckii]|nr:hypothetical protein KC353_g55 [Hortaea werneckii]
MKDAKNTKKNTQNGTTTADRNVYVRCRRLRAYARFIVENVTEHEAQEYVTQALTLELQTASNAGDNEFPFPPQVINEVVQYVQSRGKRSGLTEDYYDLQGDKWVLLDKAPDFSEDLREGAKDPPHVEDSRKSETEAPDFIAHICNGNSRFENLFGKMLADPLDDPAAKEYDAVVNAKVQEEAKARNFAGDARLPLSTIRQIVMSCAHLEHSKAIVANLAGRGADLVDGDGNRLPDGEDVYNTWSKHFHDLLDSKGYPPEWIKHFNRTVPGLAARRGKDSPYTIEEIQRVATQHGEPMTESVYTRQLQERDSAIKSSETPLTPEADARKRKRRGSSPDGDGDSPAHKRLDDRSSTEPRSPHDVSSNEPAVEGESLNDANEPQASHTSAEAQTTDRDAAMGEGGIPPTAEESSSQVRNEVFTDPDRQEGKIGGFRVASKKRDGTEYYQVDYVPRITCRRIQRQQRHRNHHCRW